MSTRDELAQQALSLPPADRAYLADILEQSLIDQDLTTAELAQAWTREIDRRLDAYDRGEIQATDVQTALAEMRREFSIRTRKT